MRERPAILMTEPDRFAVKGGMNPHTRLADGTLKTVDPAKAVAEWHRFAAQLVDRGIDVYVIPYVDGLTGMVFPANAGVVSRLHERVPISQKRFYPSEFAAPHRAAERPHFLAFLRALGFPIGALPSYKFEGEADFFPVGEPGDEGGERYLFTFGELAPTSALPGAAPDAIRYGFRSDERLSDVLQKEVAGGRPVVPVRLVDPRYYHGDTCLCAAGELLLFYPAAVDEPSRARVRATFGDRLLELSDEDAGRFVANSFVCAVGGERVAFLPEDASDQVAGALRERGLVLERTRLGEFLGKGGGGGKCMVFNLGVLVDDPAAPPARETLAFREARRYEVLRKAGAFARHGLV